MSYLNYTEILALCTEGQMAGWDVDCVNTASLDVRLGSTILVEQAPQSGARPLDYRRRDKMQMVEVDISAGYVLRPNQFILAHTLEKCNFSDSLAALFRIKSSMGRMAFEHLDAGWVDPGFHGALTLEFKNLSQHHEILIRPGDRIGQLVFFRGSEVRPEQSYRTRGNYSGADGVRQAGFAKESPES